MTRALALVLIAACGGGSPSATKPTVESPPSAVGSTETPSELSAALKPLAWLEGDWDIWHFHAAGGALYGLVFRPYDRGGFAVHIIDDGPTDGPLDGKLRVFITADGQPMDEMPGTLTGEHSVSFAKKTGNLRWNDVEHSYSVEGDALLVGGHVGDSPLSDTYKRSPPLSAPELEAADRAFSADVGKRGVDGWMAAFAPDGSMLRKNAKITGAEISAMMKPLLDGGTLAWEPLASGIAGGAHANEFGFTVGTATFTGKTPANGWRSSYITIWAKQPDGSWKVRFDTGRPVHE